jgi:hypothetical protein
LLLLLLLQGVVLEDNDVLNPHIAAHYLLHTHPLLLLQGCGA